MAKLLLKGKNENFAVKISIRAIGYECLSIQKASKFSFYMYNSKYDPQMKGKIF